MRAEHNPDLVSRLDLERWALGALDPERAAALEVRRQSDAELSARMERVRAEISAAGCDLPPLELPVDEQEEVYAPVRVAPWWRSLLRPGGLALAAATTIAVVVVVALPPDPLGTPEPTPGGQEIFRGALDLELHRVRLGTASPQGSLVAAREGDHLQFTLTSPGAGVLQVYNVQDDGQVQQYLAPRNVGAKEPVTAAVVLDAYAGSERIYFLQAEQPIQLERVQAALQRSFQVPLAELDELPGLGSGVTQRSVLVIKEASP